VSGGIINLPRPVMRNANTVNSLPFSEAQQTWRDMLPAALRSKMTRGGHRIEARPKKGLQSQSANMFAPIAARSFLIFVKFLLQNM
jgi:hypothetical protein